MGAFLIEQLFQSRLHVAYEIYIVSLPVLWKNQIQLPNNAVHCHFIFLSPKSSIKLAISIDDGHVLRPSKEQKFQKYFIPDKLRL